MATAAPRIAKIDIVPDAHVVMVRFKDTKIDVAVDLSGWIATGSAVIAPLDDLALFATARVSDYGDAIEWGEPDGDLAIDATHLSLIAREQAPMTAAELAAWQDAIDLSNAEAAGLLGVSRSTFLAYKAGGIIPRTVSIASRAALRDPVILSAHLKPSRKIGRPRKASA